MTSSSGKQWRLWAGALALILLAPGAARAQEPADIAGTWEFSVTSPNGVFVWNITFEQEGAVLGGFAESNGRIFPLEGWVEGNEVGFAVTVDMADHEDPFLFTGEVDGETAAGEVDPTGGQYPEAIMGWEARRAALR